MRRSYTLEAAFEELREGRLKCAACRAAAERVVSGVGFSPRGVCGRRLCRDRIQLDYQVAALKADVAKRRREHRERGRS